MIDLAEIPLPEGLVVKHQRLPLSADASRVDRAWHALHEVLDPEVPALSVIDLGIVRDVREHGKLLEVDLTPTYSGCPATEVIERSVIHALEAAGLRPVKANTVLAPAWTSDWISEEGRRKLHAYGIAPPGRCAEPREQVVLVVRDGARVRSHAGASIGAHARGASAAHAALVCPRCGSADTETLSAFGSTACKSLHRCRSCREPFEAFKAF